MPPPYLEKPLKTVNPERVTCALTLEIETTVLRLPPSMIVVLAPAPSIFNLIPIMRFSVYVAAATLMESPDDASAMACPMVLQAVRDDLQWLLSLPCSPSTYHVVLAKAFSVTVTNKSTSSRLLNVAF